MRAILTAAVLALIAPAPAAAGPHFFKAPWVSAGSTAGDTSCVLDATIARCDVSAPWWTAPKRPKSCPYDYGQGVWVRPASRRGSYVCASDTVLGASRTLRVGAAVEEGRMRCTAHRRWITCTNGRRHGFRVGPGRREFF